MSSITHPVRQSLSKHLANVHCIHKHLSKQACCHRAWLAYFVCTKNRSGVCRQLSKSIRWQAAFSAAQVALSFGLVWRLGAVGMPCDLSSAAFVCYFRLLLSSATFVCYFCLLLASATFICGCHGHPKDYHCCTLLSDRVTQAIQHRRAMVTASSIQQ